MPVELWAKGAWCWKRVSIGSSSSLPFSKKIACRWSHVFNARRAPVRRIRICPHFNRQQNYELTSSPELLESFQIEARCVHFFHAFLFQQSPTRKYLLELTSHCLDYLHLSRFWAFDLLDCMFFPCSYLLKITAFLTRFPLTSQLCILRFNIKDFGDLAQVLP